MTRDTKILEKRLRFKKLEHKGPAQSHPLYMDIPTALKYIRAAEVGQPAKKTTVSIQITIVPEKGSIPLQGRIHFPRPIKDNKGIVFTLDPQVAEQVRAINDGITVGGTELIDKVAKDQVDLSQFNQSYATPEMVAFLKPVARILGTKALMPTAKRGTVSDNLAELIEKNFGAYNFKQKGTELSFPVGRCDFSDAEIIRNMKAASAAIFGLQPPGTKKPNVIGRCHILSTLGPAVVIDFTT